MSYLERFSLWRQRRQAVRCARGRHNWKSLGPDRIVCGPHGCGKRWGQ